MRRAFWIAGVGLVAICCVWLTVRHESPLHNLAIRAYYHSGTDLRRGMLVAVDGVDLGSVESVTVRPELGDRPVEVVLKLTTPYRLEIPGGSIAQIGSRGALGPTVVEIDTRTAHGPPIPNGGSIDGRESTDAQVSHALGVIVKAAVGEAKEDQKQEKSTARPAK